MDFHDTAKKVARVEFWVATVILLMAMYSLVEERDSLTGSEYPYATEIIPFASPFLREFVQYLSIYGAFVFLTLYVVPRLLRSERVVLQIVWMVLTTIGVGIVFGSFDNGIAPLSAFLLYSGFKHGLIYLWSQSEEIHSRFRFLAPGVLLTGVLWLIGIVLFIISEADRDIIAAWVALVPSGILLYSFSFFLFIPDALKARRPYLAYVMRIVAVLAIASLPIGVLSYWITSDEEAMMTIIFLNVCVQLFVTMPVTWWIYKRHKAGADEIASLQTELGHSTASIDFLRSQINPHFLFNAMNTLYGTAIQEKAERTAEAIQKLGDMMRFMLHENMQPKILLSREIEYMRNYIGLQRLRTDTIPGVNIETRIEETLSSEQISPMLLIPFVENAFKHGISFREQSFIRISLNVSSKTLHFDVTNSQHPRLENDPEKDKSGIGLENVKKRLQLLYPKKHELIIRETGREFFVHLSIQLS
jgi:two-component system LytT family sensor kinase